MIRQLGLGDVADYRRIRLEGLLHDPAAFMMTYADWSKRPLADFAARLDRVAMFAAFRDDRIVATAGLESDKTDAKSDWIVEVYVTRDYRGCGLSDAIVTHVLAQNSHQDLRLEVAAANAPARALYARLGFCETMRDTAQQSAKNGSVCEILMTRPAP